MPHAMNFGPKPGYKTAPIAKATVKHAQSNFEKGARTTKEGGTNKSRVPQQFRSTKGIPRHTQGPRSFFGEKSGTGQNNGY